MAAPNLINPTTITGKTTYVTLANTNETDLLTNASASNKALRVTSIYAANIDGVVSVDCTLKIYSAASGGTGYPMVNTVSVPADATVVLVGKDAPIWLEEDRRLTVQASAGNDLTVVCSYEEVG
jgi:hypothetical protein